MAQKAATAIIGLLLLTALARSAVAQDTYQRAKAAFEQGRLADTLAILADASNSESRTPAVYNLMALAYVGLHRYEDALAANRQARELDPGNVHYVYNAGLIYLDKGDPKHSELVFREALKYFPNSALLYQGLSESLFNLNRFGEAETYLNRAAEISPKSASVYVDMVRLQYALGDGVKLGAAASKAIALDVGNYLACFYYGTWLMQYQHEAERGKGYIKRSIDLQPRFVEGLKSWGRIQSQEGRWTDAVRTYEKAVAIDPHDDQLFYLLAVAYRKIGEERKAEQALAQYRELAK